MCINCHHLCWTWTSSICTRNTTQITYRSDQILGLTSSHNPKNSCFCTDDFNKTVLPLPYTSRSCQSGVIYAILLEPCLTHSNPLFHTDFSKIHDVPFCSISRWSNNANEHPKIYIERIKKPRTRLEHGWRRKETIPEYGEGEKHEQKKKLGCPGSQWIPGRFIRHDSSNLKKTTSCSDSTLSLSRALLPHPEASEQALTPARSRTLRAPSKKMRRKRVDSQILMGKKRYFWCFIRNREIGVLTITQFPLLADLPKIPFSHPVYPIPCWGKDSRGPGHFLLPFQFFCNE